MKKILFLLTFSILTNIVKSQTMPEIGKILNSGPVDITETSASSTNDDLIAVDMTSARYKAIVIQVTGTWTGTISFQGSNNNFATTPDAIPVYQPALNTWTTTTTSNGTFSIPCQYYSYVRVRLTTATSGTATSTAWGEFQGWFTPTGPANVSVVGTVPVNGTFWQATQPVSAASLPLPTGAATEAKQPAPGTAGSPSTDVISVQGVASGQPIIVDNSSVTQPISASSLPLPSGAATSTKQSDGSQKAQVVDGSGNVVGSTSNALDINIKSGNPTSITANAGTNLNTSTLAVESGGNLAQINTNTAPLLSGQGSTTSGQKGPLVQGAVTTSAPTYTTAQTNPLSLTTAGALRVDNSGNTQPVSGTVTVQQSTATSMKTQAEAYQGGSAVASGNPLQVTLANTGANSTAVKVDGSAVTQPVSIASAVPITDNSGALTIDIAGTSPALGPVSNSASANVLATVAAGTYNATPPTITDTRSNAIQLDAKGNLRNVIRDGAGNDRAANVNASSQLSVTVDNTPNVGTVTTVTGITNVVHVDDNAASLSVDIAGTSPQLGPTANQSTVNNHIAVMPSAIYNATPVTMTDTRFGNFQLDVNGYLKTNVTNTVTVGSHAVTNAGTFPVQVDGSALTALQLIDNLPNTIGSTTSGQSGALSMAATTTAAPSYTTAQTNPLSLQTDGSLRVANTAALPTGSNVIGAVTQSGTFTVQPGNTANTTAWLTQNTPATSGGFTTYHLMSAGTTNATVVKASAGQLYGYYIYNSNAAARKLVFHNASSTPTAGASVYFTLMIPAGSAANVFNDTGIPFSTGISITTVTDAADNGTTAVAANDLNINLFYK